MDTTKFELKESIAVEGITADHVWYNADILTRSMTSWSQDFRKLVSIMEARHKEHLNMIAELLKERTALKRELAELKPASKE
jgi:riboflavin synthase